MANEYQTTKIWKKTLRILNLIKARTDESIVRIIHRLAEKELKKVEKEQ